MLDTNRDKIASILQSNSRLKYQKQTGDRFLKKFLLDVRTSFNPTEIFQYTNFYSCRLPGVTKGFIKEEALRLLRTNSSQTTSKENVRTFATHLRNRGYPAATLVVKHLSEVKFSERETSLANEDRTHERKFCPLSHNTIRLCLA